jgi:hypothetical protein
VTFAACVAAALHVKVKKAIKLIADFEAHLTGGAGDDRESGFIVARTQVFALGVHNVHDLLARDFADFRFVRLFGAGSDAGGFLQQDRRGRTLGDEVNDLSLKMVITTGRMSPACF